MTGEDELTAGHNTGGKAPEIMIISGSWCHLKDQTLTNICSWGLKREISED